jgi:Tfp pilus assembly protein PilF
MKTIFSGFLLTVSQALICFAPLPLWAQSAGNGDLICVHVTDRAGQAIPNAEAIILEGGATLSGMDHNWSDAGGLIRLRLEGQRRPSPSIVVTARGYQPQQYSLINAGMNEFHVVLEAIDPGMPRVGHTVSAAELPEARQKKAGRFNRQGIEAFRGGDYMRAEQMFLQAVSLAPSSPAFYTNMGVTIVQRGEVERSFEWFEKAHQLQPYDPIGMGNLGILRWVQNRYAESLQLLDRAVASGFQNPSAHYILGFLALENGDWLRAEKELSLVPNKGFPYKDLFRSVAQVRLGRARAAAKSLSEFRKRNPVPYSVAILH